MDLPIMVGFLEDLAWALLATTSRQHCHADGEMVACAIG